MQAGPSSVKAVNAGIMLILEAALEEDGWRDVDVFKSAA